MPEGSEDGQFKFVFGGTCAHNPEARWVIPGMKSRLAVLDGIYKAKFGARISFNDASVKFGGKLDNNTGTEKNPLPGGRDSSCHDSHHRGVDIDLNSGDEKGENIRTKTYLENGITKTRLDYIEIVAKRTGLKKVKEDYSIHFRHKSY